MFSACSTLKDIALLFSEGAGPVNKAYVERWLDQMYDAVPNDITTDFSKLTNEEKEDLACMCGHPANNHFSHGSEPCAHCKCKQLTEQVNVGIVLHTNQE